MKNFRKCKNICADIKGSVLIVVIISIMTVSVLTLSLFRLVPTAKYSNLEKMNQIKSLYVAKSGLNYADAWLCQEDMGAENRNLTLGTNYFDNQTVVDLAANVIDASQREYLVSSIGKVDSTSFNFASSEFQKLIACGPLSDFPSTPEEYVFHSGGGAMTIASSGNVDGSVYGDTVTLGNQVTVTGQAISEGDVTLINHSDLGGDICAAGNVSMGNHTQVGGDIHSHGNVTVGANASEVMGTIYASGDVFIQNLSEVYGEVHAGGSVVLGGNNSKVHGNVYANSVVRLESERTSILNDVYSGDDVILEWKATVDGIVRSEGDIDLSDGRGLITGDAIAFSDILIGWKSDILGIQSTYDSDPGVIIPESPQVCPDVPAPEQSVFTAGTTDISVPYNNNRTITPGAYGDISTGGKNEIYLSSSTPDLCEYVFQSISFDWDLNLYLDLSNCIDNGNPGGIRIFSEGDVSFDGKMDILIKTESSGVYRSMHDVDYDVAERIYWETYQGFELGHSSEWFGTVLSGNNIDFNSTNLRVIGAYATVNGEVSMEHGSEVTYILADYAEENW